MEEAQLEISTIMAAINIIKNAVKSATKKAISRRSLDSHLKKAVTEILKIHPDIAAAEASLRAAEAISGPPSVQTLRTRVLIDRLKSFERSGAAIPRSKHLKLTAKRKMATKKAVIRKTVKRKRKRS